MLYWMCEKTDMSPTGPQILHAIKRNFGGLKEENLDPVQEFIANLPSGLNQPPDLQIIPSDVSSTPRFLCFGSHSSIDVSTASSICKSRHLSAWPY